MKAVIGLGLGSNIGNAAANIREAFARLDILLDNAKLSPLYAAPPMYRTDQDWFVNAVVLGETDLSPRELLEQTQGIEKGMGRIETFKNGPRLIDLDILFYGDQSIKEEGLIVPHPRMEERQFVLHPLRDVKPDWVHPVTKRSVSDMIDALPKGDLYVLA